MTSFLDSPSFLHLNFKDIFQWYTYCFGYRKSSLPVVVNILLASAPKLVAMIIGCKRRDKLMSDMAMAMMNQWVVFILFFLAHRVSNTIELATIDTTTAVKKPLHCCNSYFFSALIVNNFAEPICTYPPWWWKDRWCNCTRVGVGHKASNSMQCCLNCWKSSSCGHTPY